MVNFGPLAAEIVSLVWGTPGNFSGFRVLAALLHAVHGTLGVGVSQTAALNRGPIYIRQGGHHVGHWPTFLVTVSFAGSLRPTDTDSVMLLSDVSVYLMRISLIALISF